MTNTQFLIDVSTELTNLNVEHLIDDGEMVVEEIVFTDKYGYWGGFVNDNGTPTTVHLDLSPDPTALELATAIKRVVDGKKRQEAENNLWAVYDSVLVSTTNCSNCSAEMDANETGICNRCNPVTRDEPNGVTR